MGVENEGSLSSGIEGSLWPEYPFTPPVGIEEYNPNAFSVYPNPASDELHISSQILSSISTAILVITDVTGKVVFRNQLTSSTGATTIDVSSFPVGLYNWRIEEEGEIFGTEKFSIIR